MISTLGIDCSHWQDDKSTAQKMDFKKAAASGAYFVFVKVSERGAIDLDFEYNWKAAKAAGLLRGGYHFLRWDLPALTQARLFCGCLEGDVGELPPVADFEAPPAGSLYPSNALLLQFLEEVERILNRRPMIYTSPGFWRAYGNNKTTKKPDSYWSIYPLWIAHYGVKDPLIPAPWQTWTFWQYTNAGDGSKFGAESKGIDLNLFNGSIDELYALVDKTNGKLPGFAQIQAAELSGDEACLNNQISHLNWRLKNVEDFLASFRLP